MRTAGGRILANYPRFVSVEVPQRTLQWQTIPPISLLPRKPFIGLTAMRARGVCSHLENWRWVGPDLERRRLPIPHRSARLRRASADLRHGFQEVRHENVYDNIAAFFAPSEFKLKSFDNQQVFDYEGLKGRLLSSSYIPAEGQPGFTEMLETLRRVFDAHQQDGHVVVAYHTRVYFGQLDSVRSNKAP